MFVMHQLVMTATTHGYNLGKRMLAATYHTALRLRTGSVLPERIQNCISNSL